MNLNAMQSADNNNGNFTFQVMPAEIKMHVLDLLPNKKSDAQEEKIEIKQFIETIKSLSLTSKTNYEELQTFSPLIFKNFIKCFKITTLLQISQLPKFLKENFLLELKNNKELKQKISLIKKEIIKKCDHDVAPNILKKNARISHEDINILVGLIHLNILRTPELKISLLVAAKLNYEKFAKFLLSHRADVDSVNREIRTPLMIAILNGNDALTRLFMYNEANIDKTDLIGDSALMIAIRCKRTNIAKELISLGAKTDFKNRRNHTALTIAKFQDLTEIEALLQIKNFNNDQEALKFAAANNNLEMATLLIDKVNGNILQEAYDIASKRIKKLIENYIEKMISYNKTEHI